MSVMEDFSSNGKSTMRDLSTGFLPITIVVAIMAAVFWLGFGYSKLVTSNDNTDGRVTALVSAMEEQKSAIRELSTQVSELRRAIGSVPSDAMRTRDFTAQMAGFCLKFERLNRGVKCPAEM
jgi:hypothetical protein